MAGRIHHESLAMDAVSGSRHKLVEPERVEEKNHYISLVLPCFILFCRRLLPVIVTLLV